MRIVCQQCSAEYVLDDKVVTAQGVRAQCPRCPHQQVVRLPAQPAQAAAPKSAAASFPTPSPTAFLFDMGGLPSASAAAKVPKPPPGVPTSSKTPSPFDFDAALGTGAVDFGTLTPLPQKDPQGADLDSLLGAGAKTVPGSPFDSNGVDIGEVPPPPPPSRKQVPHADVTCRTCGKVLNDPFDQALGTCEECRNKGEAAPVPPSSAQRTHSGPVARITHSAPAVAPAAVRSATRENVNPEPQLSEDEQTWGKKKVIGLGVGVVVALVLIALGISKPWVKPPPPLAVKPSPAVQPVDSIIGQWRLKYVELDPSSFEKLMSEGQALLLKDTPQGYQAAEQRFEQALVLDVHNERALAGWALALAFGHNGQIDDATTKSAESMLLSAEQRGGAADVFVAHAHFLIARHGNPNDIKVLAERALASPNPREKALAMLAIGQTTINKNVQQAAASFNEALSVDPSLKRVYFFQSELAAIQGKYSEAIRLLERRLELDSEQLEATEALARLLVDVGDTSRAKAVLEAGRAAAPHAGRPRLLLAMLNFQHLSDFRAAEQQLTALVDDAELSKGDRSEALVQLAALLRTRAEAGKASEAIERALELNPSSVPAKLQRFLLLLDKGTTGPARLDFEALKGKLGDKYLDATLEGRLLIAENKLTEALQILSATAEAEPRRVDAMLLAGAAAAKAAKDGKAWDWCLRRAMRSDPFTHPVPSLTSLWVRPADLLKPALGAYSAIAGKVDEDPDAALCEGLVAWFSEDFAQAEKHFTRATSIDSKNADGYAYRALSALRRNDSPNALKWAGRGLDSSKTNALVYFAQAQTQMRVKKTELARSASHAALKYGPQLLGPRVLLGEAEASGKDPDEARRMLTSVLLSDPLYRDAKRVLYKHQL